MVANGSNELSERELEILRLVATGASNKEIAYKLVISPNTVKVHLRNIFSKIGAQSRTEAAMYAVRIGLVKDISPSISQQSLLESDPGQVQINFIGWVRRNRLIVAMGLLLLLSVSIILQLILSFPKTSPEVSFPTPTLEPRWKRLADMPTARAGLAAVAYENYIYAIGGENDNGVVNVTERYDPVLNQWKKLASKITPVSDIEIALVEGKLYVPGGKSTNGSPTDQFEVYDIASDHWETLPPLPTPMFGYGIAVYEDKIFVVGGWDGSTVLDTVYLYDTSRGTWSLVSHLPKPRAYMGVILVNDSLHIMGGWDGDKSTAEHQIVNINELQGPNPNWQTLNDLIDQRSFIDVLSIADFIFIVGRSPQTNNKESIPIGLQFNLSELNWGKLYDPPLENWNKMAVVTLGRNLHLLGGMSSASYLSANYAYEAVKIISIPIIR